MINLDRRWVEHFFKLCQCISEMSKDPSTKVGSLIVRPDKTIVSTGFNGFPKGCNDSHGLYLDRESKYQRIIHAEMNAILHSKERLEGYALFCWPIPPCDRCMPHIIQSGIKSLFVPEIQEDHRWYQNTRLAELMAIEAGLTVVKWRQE